VRAWIGGVRFIFHISIFKSFNFSFVTREHAVSAVIRLFGLKHK